MLDTKLNEVIVKAFELAGYIETLPTIQESKMPNLCDYQCNDCFSLAKKFSLPPLKIAERIVDTILNNESLNKYFKKVETAPPGFINFTLSDKAIHEELISMIKNEKFNFEEIQNKETFFLDYGGPNIAKPLHVGHLRSPIIGESIKRIINYAGHKTISDVYFGDFGLQIGEVIYGMMERNISIEKVTLKDLEEIYPQISERIKSGDSKLYDECSKITKELQEGNELYREYWKVIRELSSEDIKRIYKYMDINFDTYNGESAAFPYISKMKKILEDKNLLKTSEGAKIVDVSKPTDKKELPPLIFQKTNGGYIYGTTDVSTILLRVENYKPDYMIYVVDARQELHFTQVFRTVAKAGIIDEENLELVGFGTVNGTDGKPFKTREGKSPQLDSLFGQVKELLIANKDTEKLSEEDLDIIVNSVIKFADLQNNNEKDYIFDLEKFSKTSGKTGPYILYTYVRIKKVIEKFSQTNATLKAESKNDIERDVKLKLLSFERHFNKAFAERKPNYLADFVFDLSNLLNNFYEQNRFTDKENEQYLSSWIELLKLSLNVIQTILDILVIKLPSKM